MNYYEFNEAFFMQEYEKIHNRLVRGNASECVVLLNYDASFPLEGPCDVDLFGPGARNTITGGFGSGEVNNREIFSIERGLEEAGFVVQTKYWFDTYEQIKIEKHKELIQQIKRNARKHHTFATLEAMNTSEKPFEYEIPLNKKSDLAIYVLSRNSGEGVDRENIKGDIQLLDSEVRDIQYLNEHYSKFILVLNVCGVVDLSPLHDIKNILLLSQLGALTGQIFADILLGKVIPSGHLASTWARFDAYPHIGDFGDINNTEYKEGIYVGYRYFDSANVKPIYPFGYGLNYSKFELDKAEIRKENSKIYINTTIKNVGQKRSKEVVQLYINKPSQKIAQPLQDLAAFKKSEYLDSGQLEKLSLSFDLANIASYDESSGNYILEKGIYILNIGFNSKDVSPIGSLEVKEEIITRKAFSHINKPSFEDYRIDKKENAKVSPCIEINQDDIEIVIPAERKEEVLEEVKTLSMKELALLSVGGFDKKKSPLALLANPSNVVPGAAGETTRLVKDYRSIVMADGPAGLRLFKQYFVRKGEAYPVKNDMVMLDLMHEVMPKFLRKILGSNDVKPKPNEKIYEQYATSIPIATAIAQSFNLEVAEQFGIMVGDQMDRFNVDLWLAPGLNIHRDIRCGRNFEYYSEDPLMSGKFAAAITRGVQSHAKRGTVIKHYIANNQERNRTNNSSWLSERVIRDIYIKGFEIAIKESNPKGVMSSYNLLNGVHTSESRWLSHDMLRVENNYQGVLMTDWIVFQGNEKGGTYKKVSFPKTVNSGHTFIMPGRKLILKKVNQGIRSGEIKREQLEVNVSYLIRLIKN